MRSSIWKGPLAMDSAFFMTSHTAASLDSLPPEILEMIISYLHRNDLNTLSRSCKYLNAISLPRLYHTVELRIPATSSLLESFEKLLIGFGEGLKWTRQLYILTQPAPLPERLDIDSERTFLLLEEGLGSDSASDASRALNTLMRQLIKRIPRNRLQIFHWRHSAPMDEKTLLSLMSRQGRLRDLSLHDLDTKFPISFRSIVGLEVLRFGDLSLSVSLYWACTMIAQNLKTLRHLKIGAEGEIAWYEKHRTLYSSTYHWIAPKFGEIFKQKLVAAYGNSHPVLSLSSLTLDGIEPHLLESRTSTRLFDWANLSALTINSCSYLKFALNFLRSKMIEPSDGHPKATRLKSLDLRSDEKSSSGPISYCFLTSFTGLVHLGLLLTDDNIRLLDLASILSFHGPTLRSFVWDIRCSNRPCLTRLNRFRSIQVICEKCPHLVELGLTLNWKDFDAGEHGCLEQIVECLQPLTLLRTLHIRNVPLSSKMLSFRNKPLLGKNIDSFPTQLLDREIAKSVATRMIEEYCRPRRNQPPALETIAVGSMIYRDIYPSCEYPPTARFQMLRSLGKLRIYGIKYWHAVPGVSIPALHVVGEGTTTAAKHVCRDIHILDHYWLG